MRFLLFLLLLVAGCAAPGRELHRGTTVAPPPPPPVRPGHGAPVVGQPGQQGGRVPWSPHQRELPPTKEPGLWAGDAPQAARKGERQKPQLFGVPLPRVEVQGDAFEQEGPARACELVWAEALAGTGLAAEVSALKPRERRCVAAKAFQNCIRLLEHSYDEAGAAGVVQLAYRQYRAATGQAAEDFTREACAEVPETPEQRRLLEKLRRRLHDFLEE